MSPGIILCLVGLLMWNFTGSCFLGDLSIHPAFRFGNLAVNCDLRVKMRDVLLLRTLEILADPAVEVLNSEHRLLFP